MRETEAKLKSVLSEFFRDNFYTDAIKKLRKSLNQKSNYRDSWKDIILMILNKKLEKGKALALIHTVANLPLDENTDDEAYKWLTLMLINSMGTEDSMIIEY